MVRVARSTVLPVEVGAGFDYITDPANWPMYWPNLISVEALNQPAWRVPGDMMRLQMRIARRDATLEMTLQELRRPALVRYRSVQDGLPDAVHERHFSPARGGLQYRAVVTFTPRPGAAGLFDRTVFRVATGRALRRAVANLHRQLA